MNIIGVRRGKDFSPNHIGNDEAIFSLTLDALQREGYVATVYTEEEFLRLEVTTTGLGVVSMAREKEVVKKLQRLEEQGAVVVNSGFGVEQCFRTNMTKLLIANQIPYPKSIIVSTECTDERLFNEFPQPGVWIKRGDFHAIHKEDVTFVSSREEGLDILREYALRGIPDAVISKHLVGDLVKFYGVRGTDFFYWFYPYEHNHHKYAHYENINGKLVYNPFDADQLKQIAIEAAAVLRVDIFGGDAIVDAAGNMYIIDLNDWPSFAPCREAAAKAIAPLLVHKFQKQLDGIIASEK